MLAYIYRPGQCLDPEVDALISFIFLHQGSLAREAAEAVTEDTMSKTLHD